ncbi:MAG: heme o synthase [Gammaproteobacteria bacterium]
MFDKIPYYIGLTKPKVVILMLITSLVGMFLSIDTAVPVPILVFGTIGIGFAAAAAAVLNHIADQKADALMRRTQKRPLPMQQVTEMQAIIFAVVLTVISMTVLIVYVNTLTAVLSFASLIGYAGIYTGVLKRLTPQNIVIGGLAGATPPLLGWAAVTDTISPHALLLVLIIFVWTPPHFWSLALHRLQDYQKANIPMLPVTHGVPFTKRCIVLYTVLLCGASVLPYVVGMSHLLYLGGALMLDVIFLGFALRLMRGNEPWLAIQTFHYSNIYLCLLFTLLLVDHYI